MGTSWISCFSILRSHGHYLRCPQRAPWLAPSISLACTVLTLLATLPLFPDDSIISFLIIGCAATAMN